MKTQTRTRAETTFRDPPLLEQSQALTLYLDSLFRDMPPQSEEAPAPAEITALPASDMASPDRSEPLPPGSGFEKLPFSCLLIGMGDVRLAVPMSSLFGIRRMPEKPVRLPGSPPWVVGMLGGGDDKVQVVDLAALLSSDGAAGLPQAGTRHAVIIAEGRWAIGCEAASRTLRVDPVLVRWSGGNARRPWLAGIVPGELCTLLDVQALVTWLDRGGRDPE